MKNAIKIEKKVLETFVMDLLQAFNVLDSKQRPERYKIDFAMARISGVIGCLERNYLKEKGVNNE